MDEIVNQVATSIALVLEAVAAIMVAYGGIEALAKLVKHIVSGRSAVGWRKDLFIGFGVWLLLGLQFALGADIVRTLIAPTWNDLGELAAIAVIRTFLNYFLEKDLKEVGDAAAEEPKLTRAS